VEIDHGLGLTTRYGHMSRVLVKVGDEVASGDVIGLSGNTGRSTGPHLHYEVRRNGEALDPMRFLNTGMKLTTLID
ncbi:MAG: M23 family metallopeptidase, partial [Rhizobium sp.]|nr:M23 family metallopeptidase [Rhizobium sp.]